MTCDEVNDLLGAFSLDALPGDEMRDVRDHLAGCQQHEGVQDLLAAGRSLAFEPEERDPPTSLKARIMREVHGETSVDAAQHARDDRGIFSWLRPPTFQPALIAVLSVAVIGLAVWVAVLQSSTDDAFVRTLAGDSPAAGKLVVVSNENLAVLSIEGLEPLASDRAYQAWTISDGVAESAGILSVENGKASVAFQLDPSVVDSVAITIEPAGGSSRPTSDPILAADL
ncbi:MAG: anti-sigma factor [Chloroflexi bacterium]|nr:anti-sigma factor [Chloroflexota bacterium]